jgi:V/A-type H+/Na+-transporting ATPase subunit D
MAEPRRAIATTRIALLELKDEQQLVQEGYRLLDEKCILLAAGIRRQLERLRAARAQLEEAQQAARAALTAALLRHGLDELAVHRPASLGDTTLGVVRSALLGLQLLEASLVEAGEGRALRPAEGDSAEVRECVRAQHALLAAAVALAACCLSLRRLVREYVRTERRTRALENILLPEISDALKLLEEQLDGLDQEELARLRYRLSKHPGLAEQIGTQQPLS